MEFSCKCPGCASLIRATQRESIERIEIHRNVIPAKAGTQLFARVELGPGYRRDEGLIICGDSCFSLVGFRSLNAVFGTGTYASSRRDAAPTEWVVGNCLRLSTQTKTEPCGSVFDFQQSPTTSGLQTVQVTQLAGARAEVGGEVGDVLVAQLGRLRRHQCILAITQAVGLQRVRQVIGVLATQLGIGGIDWRIAVRTVAIDAALSSGLALGFRQLLANVDAAGGQTVGGGRTMFTAGVAGIFGGDFGVLGAGGLSEGGEEGDG